MLLSSKLLEQLRAHWHRLRRKPSIWLFPGNRHHSGDQPIDMKTVWHACQQAAQRAGIQKKVHARHGRWIELVRFAVPSRAGENKVAAAWRVAGCLAASLSGDVCTARRSTDPPQRGQTVPGAFVRAPAWGGKSSGDYHVLTNFGEHVVASSIDPSSLVRIGWEDRIILHLRYPNFIDFDEPTHETGPILFELASIPIASTGTARME